MMKLVAVLTVSILGIVSLNAKEYIYGFSSFSNEPVEEAFHVPIVLKESANSFSYMDFAADASDLCITDADGTPLPYEIESWDPAGISVIWVKVPQFSKDTKLKLKQGSPAAFDRKAFWNDAAGVFHFGAQDALNSADGSVFDEYSPSEGSDAQVKLIDAPVGSGAKFEKKAYYRQLEEPAIGTYLPEKINTFTVSYWFKTDNLLKASNQAYLFQIHANAAHQIAILLNYDRNEQVRFYFNNSATGTFAVDNFDLSLKTDGDWHHFAYTYDGAKFTAYCDGFVVYEKSFSGFYINAATVKQGSFSIGSNKGGGYSVDGSLDEFRFERVCRSAAYIRASVETQASSGLSVFNSTTVVPFSDYDGAELKDFPAYIALDEVSYPAINNLAQDLADGSVNLLDLRTKAHLPVEVEFAYNNQFDRCAGLWVRMPRYSSQDGVLIARSGMYYSPSDARVRNLIGPDNVWTSKHEVLVFHLNPTGKISSVSTPITLDLTDVKKHPVAADGPTGPYQAYHSTTCAVQQIASPTFALKEPMTNVWTISWWSKVDEEEFASPKPETYLWVFGGWYALAGSGYTSHYAGANRLNLGSGKAASALDIPDDRWHHYAYAADGTKIYCYADGELIGTHVREYDFGLIDNYPSGKPIRLMSSSVYYKDAFRGCADELRFESVCRDGNWIKASYLNQLAWRDGVAYQFAPHLGAVSGSVSPDGVLSAKTKLSCRTGAMVKLCCALEDKGKTFSSWDIAVDLGSFSDSDIVSGEVSVPGLAPGKRCAFRFRVENEYGTYWSDVQYAAMPLSFARGSKAKITVNYTGEEILENFPLCIRIPETSGLPSDKSAVHFFDEQGRTLPWEAEVYDPSGESVVWVRVPRLGPQSVITMRFGRGFVAGNEWANASVWKSDEYAGVWHFSPSEKSGVITADSSAYGSDIVVNGLRAYSTQGVSGQSYYFPAEDGMSGQFTLSSENANGKEINDFGEGFTFSCWLKIPDQEGRASNMFVKHELKDKSAYPGGTGHLQYQINYLPSDNTVFLYPSSSVNSIYPGFPKGSVWPDMVAHIKSAFTCSRPDQEWHHYAMVSDGMFLKMYLDGECVKKTLWPLVLNGGHLNSKRMVTNFGNNITTYNWARGGIDEYRLERVGRSLEWIKACFDNQRADSTFVTVGNTERQGMFMLVR